MKRAALDVIDAIGSGHQRTREIARATGLPMSNVWWRVSELCRAGLISAVQIPRRGVHGRPPKLYRLNPWSAKP